MGDDVCLEAYMMAQVLYLRDNAVAFLLDGFLAILDFGCRRGQFELYQI
jgi:hypothetical protein